MSFIKKHSTIIWLAIYFSFISTFLFFLLHFLLSQSEKQPYDFVVQAGIFFLLIFFFSIVLFYFRVEISFINKIKNIYQDFSTTTGRNILNDNQSEVEMLTENLQKFASERKLEIELLKEKENYRKEFIGNLSHELKTPLFTIQGYV